MAKVTIYTRPFCGYCARAISLFREKKVDFNEIEAGFDPTARADMIRRSGRHTYPQIFIGETAIGGCDELVELERSGRLDGLLATP